MDDASACEIGTALWEQYRTRHPEAPAIPPDCSEDLPDPDADEYWFHVTDCSSCNEV
jgi:hypothetical protein